MTKHKVFISYYHHDDQYYKNYIDAFLSGNIVNKSVMAGVYNSDNSDQYIKTLIREDKVSDSSVVVVLIGPNTWKRKHVDWEISAGLNPSVNGNSGLIGILLPSYPMIGTKPSTAYLPGRILDNWSSGYAKLYTWNYAINHFDAIIEQAYYDRISLREKIKNSRPQMQLNYT